MTNRIFEFEFNGYNAIIVLPNNFNGKWIWKTEFFTAFDKAEVQLLNMGYARVYYQISDKYGSPNAVKLMKDFYDFIIKEFNLNEKCILFGFSRGGLYAFNFAIKHPLCVDKIYLDAPVLDLKTWPHEGTFEQEQMLAEYKLTKQELLKFKNNPIDKIDEFFSLSIPLLLIAGDRDEVVPFKKNSGLVIDFCKVNNISLNYVVKKGCLHHPHSLVDVKHIIDFCNSY